MIKQEPLDIRTVFPNLILFTHCTVTACSKTPIRGDKPLLYQQRSLAVFKSFFSLKAGYPRAPACFGKTKWWNICSLSLELKFIFIYS